MWCLSGILSEVTTVVLYDHEPVSRSGPTLLDRSDENSHSRVGSQRLERSDLRSFRLQEPLGPSPLMVTGSGRPPVHTWGPRENSVTQFKKVR